MTHEFHSAWITASGQTGSHGDPQARFPYWSFTKTVLAICALRLVEDGALALDDPVDGAAYTLRQLLNHSAGLPDYGQIPDYSRAVAAGDPPWPRAEMLDRALSGGMLFRPGEGWSYSNIGYMFVGEMIEAATDLSLAQAMNDSILSPLGLTSIELASTPQDFADLHWPAAAHHHPRWVYHGCLTGTAPDAARLLHHLMTGDLLSPASLATMRVRTPLGGPLPGRPWLTCGYGLGLMTGTVAGLDRSEGHSGCGPFCVNAVYHFPDRADPITIASFTHGHDEGPAEHAAVRIAETERPCRSS